MNKAFILVADDDADDRFLLQTAFTEKGYPDQLEFVENGVELLAYLNSIVQRNSSERNYPQFILLDLNMPKKDGRETLREIKQHPQFKNIPVVIYTTTKSETEVKQCYELGANTYIVKPASFETLLSVVGIIRAYWFQVATTLR